MLGKVAALGILGVSVVSAQWGGYLSSTYGYNTNPLYNYDQRSDQLNQGYLELKWGAGEGISRGQVMYVGSIMLFNQIGDRTYYEHSLQGDYMHRYPEREWKGQNGEPPSDETFSGSILALRAKIGARHDREAFREYDNVGGTITGSFKSMTAGTSFTLLTNELGYRRYVYVPELSNILDLLTAKVGATLGGGITGSVFVAGGVKHFTTGTFDSTSIFDTYTTPGNGNGKGKGAGNSSPGQGSQKKVGVVVNPSTANAFIVDLGGELESTWDSGSILAVAHMRINLSDSARYVAQFANTLGLSEDIYNDFFSYQGPELKLTFRHQLPLRLSIQLSGEMARRTYLAPAFDLSGTAFPGNRVDTRFSGEFYLSRYFALTDAVGFDLALSGGALSNRSNDEYNDYTVFTIALGLGIGF
jgi:hypothetical protein